MDRQPKNAQGKLALAALAVEGWFAHADVASSAEQSTDLTKPALSRFATAKLDLQPFQV